MVNSGIGGQAVLEGIMMKNGEHYAVAVRTPAGDIAVDKQDYRGIGGGRKWMQLPFIRGVFNFVDSLVLGMRTLTWSASFYEDEEETKKGAGNTEEKSSLGESVAMGGTVAVSIVLAVAIFMVLPMFAARFFERWTDSKLLISVLEGILRLAIFIGYVWAISFMKDIKRTYMYHGAEHKCINCIEHGLPLTVENVRKSSRQHKRCGTSFMLFVMLISILVFMFLQFDNVLLRLASRIVFVPVIAGISYEVLRLAGRTENLCLNIISSPGLLLQKLTTAEPEDDMIVVAIRAVEEVFDWRAFEADNFPGGTAA